MEELRIPAHSSLKVSRAKLFWKYFLVVFLSFSVLFLIGFSNWYQFNVAQVKQTKISQSSAMLKFHASLIQKEIYTIISDLKILSSLPLLDETMTQEQQDEVINELSSTYLVFMRSRVLYDQLRFIDLNGNERVRVNREPKGAFVTPPQSLQNKSNRYYFQEIRELMPGEVYISRLDLNIESGLVEIPFKPMIRLGLMLYRLDDDGINQPKGMIVVNYLAEKILRLLEHKNAHAVAMEDQNDLMMADSFGYWLEGRTVEQEWGFMFNRPNQNIQVETPMLWSAMQKSNQGSVENNQGVYIFQFVSARLLTLNVGKHLLETFSLVPSKQVGKGYGWYLIDFHSHDVLSSDANKNLLENQVDWLLAFAMGLLLSVFIAFYVSNRQLVDQRIRFLAYHDGLTGVYSRSAWNQKLVPQLNDWIKNSKPFSVAYLDVNDFKPINDELGHEIGDELLKITSQRLQGAIRSDDCVVRLGGDEFLVVFASDDTVQDSHFLMMKLKSVFSKPMKVKQHTLHVTVSVGIANASEEALSIDALVSKADERMYHDKMAMKQMNE